SVHIGDRLRIGSAEFTVTQPRMPCFKLALRFDRPDMVKRFLRSGRSGFYLRVTQEGEAAADDAITLVGREAAPITVVDIFRLYTAADADPDLLRRASELPSLAQGWREHFRERLTEPDTH
ncbi:MAG: MOSC domain-containing protein, partial [Chloroflexi bacterium]|nr:MOSC domain-containing protein [Chloroflexota bacterium]